MPLRSPAGAESGPQHVEVHDKHSPSCIERGGFEVTLSSPPGRLPIVARITRRVLWHLKVNDIVKVLEPVSMAQIAQKFERFLETYRRPDGSRWGQDPRKATAGVVTRSYITALRKGRVFRP